MLAMRRIRKEPSVTWTTHIQARGGTQQYYRQAYSLLARHLVSIRLLHAVYAGQLEGELVLMYEYS